VVKNCLKTAAGVLLDFEADPHPLANVHLTLSQSTLRGASGLLRCDAGSSSRPTSWLFRADPCVWDLQAGNSAVFQVAGRSAVRYFQQLQLQGQNCLLNDTATVASWWNSAAKQLQALDSSSLNIEGLVLARLEFAGPQNDRPADAELKTWQGPRFSARVPGFQPAELRELTEPNASGTAN
jgi:hypothetical protein